MRPEGLTTHRARSGVDGTARDLQYSKFPRLCPHPLATTSLSGRLRLSGETINQPNGEIGLSAGTCDRPDLTCRVTSGTWIPPAPTGTSGKIKSRPMEDNMESENALVTLLFGGVVGYVVGMAQTWHTAHKLERLDLKPSDWTTWGKTR